MARGAPYGWRPMPPRESFIADVAVLTSAFAVGASTAWIAPVPREPGGAARGIAPDGGAAARPGAARRPPRGAPPRGGVGPPPPRGGPRAPDAHHIVAVRRRPTSRRASSTARAAG